MAIYLGYCVGGKCRDNLAPRRNEDGEAIKQPNMWKQFWVQRELESLGISAWVGRKIEFRRVGKNRTPDIFEEPALPNYIFIDMTPEQFMKALGVKHLAITFHVVNRKEVPMLDAYKKRVDAEYRAAQRVDANSRASVAEYKKGQAVRVLSGPFKDMLAKFDEMVQSADVPWPRVQVEVEGFGAKVKLDPLDVRGVA